MNILYLNHYAGAPAYGMEYRPYYLAREWVRAGHRVTIAAASQSHVRSRQPVVQGRFTRETIDGVDYVWCDTPAYQGNGVGRVVNIVTYLRRLRQWRQWLTQPPDVVIASSTYPADIGSAAAIARRHRATLVWEVHDLWPLSPIELGGMSPRHPFIVWMQHAENRACREADVVVSMLPKADAHLLEHGMAASKFAYVPNGIDPEEWADDAATPLPAAHRAAIDAARARGHLLVAYAGRGASTEGRRRTRRARSTWATTACPRLWTRTCRRPRRGSPGTTRWTRRTGTRTRTTSTPWAPRSSTIRRSTRSAGGPSSCSSSARRRERVAGAA